MRLKVTRLFQEETFRYPTWQQRIEGIMKLGRVNVILIDGKPQTGKSTLGDFMAKIWDPNYTLVNTVDEIIQHFIKLRKLWFSGQQDKIQNTWIFWDEPQLEVPRQEFWSERNMIIQALTSSFGFLHTHLIMALPNIKGLSDNIISCVSLRISVKSYLRKGKIVRKAYVKIPLFIETKRKFFWIAVESYKIPQWELSSRYYTKKADNFFNVQLAKWEDKITKEEKKSKLRQLGMLLGSGIRGKEYKKVLEQYNKLKGI